MGNAFLFAVFNSPHRYIKPRLAVCYIQNIVHSRGNLGGLPEEVLGTSARESGRAKSHTSFVRTGATEAKITIALWNEGPEAYRPKEFGKEITVERVIGKRSTWVLRSAKGVKVRLPNHIPPAHVESCEFLQRPR